LPYDLKFLSIRDNSICELFLMAKHGYDLKGKIDLKNATQLKERVWIDFGNKNPNNLDTELYFKSILHPLSDLAKEIRHKGEKFIPMELLCSIWMDYGKTKQGANSSREMFYRWFAPIEVVSYPFYLVQKLIEWHFDIADLISKGEAIDVNRLPENPYK